MFDGDENALGKEFVTIGNERVIQNALEELNRVDFQEFDSDEAIAFADAVESMAWLRESLVEDMDDD